MHVSDHIAISGAASFFKSAESQPVKEKPPWVLGLHFQENLKNFFSQVIKKVLES